MRGYFALIGPLRRSVYVALGLKLAEALLAGAPIALLYLVLSALLAPGGGTSVDPLWFWALLAAFSVRAAIGLQAARVSTRVALDVSRYLRARVTAKAGVIPLGPLEAGAADDLTTIVAQDIPILQQVPAQALPGLIVHTVFPLVLITGLAVLDVRLALFLILAVPVSLILMRLARGRVLALNGERGRAFSHLTRRLIEYIDGLPVYRVLSAGAERHQALAQAVGALRDVNRHLVFQLTPFLLGNALIVEAGVVAVLGVGLLLYLEGGLAAATLLVFIIAGVRVAESLRALMAVAELSDGISVSVARVRRLLDSPEVVDGPEAEAPGQGRVAMEGVRWSRQGTTILDDVTFAAEPGSLTALVGASGSGKSSILRLLAGYWRADGGCVRIDGRPIEAYRTAALYDGLAFAPQRAFLFDASVADNIRIADPAAPPERLAAVAEAADCLTLLEGRSGPDAALGDDGGRVSGGEAQRIALARVLLKPAPILLLDEATSALDFETEARVWSAFRERTRDRTVIAAAHRLSTVRDADQILVLDRGRIVERGRHEALLGQGGVYAQLWAADMLARPQAEGASV